MSGLVYLLPHHPSLLTQNRGLVALPTAEETAESLPLWSIVSAVLAPQRTWSVQSLLEVLELLLLHTDTTRAVGELVSRRRFDNKTPRSDEIDFSFLRTFLYEVLSDGERDEFLRVDLPWLATLCTRLPELFPEPQLNSLTTGEARQVQLSSIQIACLLGHMFFCTTRAPAWSGFWGHMAVWHGHNWVEHPPRPSVHVYYRSLLLHWRALRLAVDSPARPVTYERRCLGDPSVVSDAAWASCSMPLLPLLPADTPATDVDMDFANKDVTFGPGSTQEERLLGTSPELLLLALLAPTLAERDALVVTGAKIAGECTLVQRELQWRGPYPDGSRDWSRRRVCCVDALEIDAMVERWSVEELRPSSLLRELNKLYAAWGGGKGMRISTGHWGCGTFGGHKQAKALIQVMAASRAEAVLMFTSVEDFASGNGSSFAASLARFVEALRAKGVTVGALFSAMLSAGDKVPHSVVPVVPDLWRLLAEKLELAYSP